MDDTLKPAIPATTCRAVYDIAREIRANWPKVYFGAVPYLQAMAQMRTVHDSFGMDDGKGIILYFLANASSWRGDVAKRIKAKLKAMVK